MSHATTSSGIISFRGTTEVSPPSTTTTPAGRSRRDGRATLDDTCRSTSDEEDGDDDNEWNRAPCSSSNSGSGMLVVCGAGRPNRLAALGLLLVLFLREPCAVRQGMLSLAHQVVSHFRLIARHATRFRSTAAAVSSFTLCLGQTDGEKREAKKEARLSTCLDDNIARNSKCSEGHC